MSEPSIKPPRLPWTSFAGCQKHIVVEMGRTIFFLELKVNFNSTVNGIHTLTIHVNNVPFEFEIAMDRSC